MRLTVKVKPNARAAALIAQPDGTWLAALRSPPIDGRANAELIALASTHFRCRRSEVVIRSGTTSRIKVLELPDSC